MSDWTQQSVWNRHSIASLQVWSRVFRVSSPSDEVPRPVLLGSSERSQTVGSKSPPQIPVAKRSSSGYGCFRQFVLSSQLR
jgi:hypothetical protein